LCTGKVPPSSGMLVVGSDMVVVVHSTGSSTAVVDASERWVSAPETTTVASGIGGAAFALASTAGSFVVT
jgi:hypothetical protein